jgi:hypothetical protein
VRLIGYTNNEVPLCLSCVERFDLTNPAERDPEDVFLPIHAEELIKHPTVRCGVPVCQTTLNDL